MSICGRLANKLGALQIHILYCNHVNNFTWCSCAILDIFACMHGKNGNVAYA